MRGFFSDVFLVCGFLCGGDLRFLVVGEVLGCRGSSWRKLFGNVRPARKDLDVKRFCGWGGQVLEYFVVKEVDFRVCVGWRRWRVVAGGGGEVVWSTEGVECD